jgi:hypothetical protein
MTLQLQLWFCEACAVEGAIEFKLHADLYSMMNQLSDAHRGARPACAAQNRLNRMRVRAPHCTDAEWAEVTKNRKDIALPRQSA